MISLRRRCAPVATLALAVVQAGCGDPGIDGEVVQAGRHVELHRAPTLAVCPASLAAADDYVERLGDLLGVAAPRISYYLYDGAISGCHLFGSADAGCASGTDVYTADWLQRHELVHAVASALGRPPAFLTEGLAEGLGTEYPQLSVRQRRAAHLEDAVDAVAFFSGSQDDVQAHYAQAADFVVFAIHRYGMARFRRLYRDLVYLADGVTIRRAFAEATGESLAQAFAAWRAHVPTAADGGLTPIAAQRCAAAALAPIASDTWAASEEVACANGTTPRGASLAQPIVHALTIERTGLYAFDADVSPTDGTSVLAQLVACGVDDAGAYVYEVPGLLPHVTELALLAPGPHTVELDPSQVLDAEPAALTTRFQLTRLGDVGADCASATVWPAPAGAWELLLRASPADWPGQDGDEAALWLRLEPAAGAASALALGWNIAAPAPGASLRACSGTCDAPTDCVSVAGEARGMSFLPPPGPIFVEVRAPRDADPIEPQIVARP